MKVMPQRIRAAILKFAVDNKVPIICPSEDVDILHHPMYEEIARLEASIAQSTESIERLKEKMGSVSSREEREKVLQDLKSERSRLAALMNQLQELNEKVEPYKMIERERFLVNFIPKTESVITVFGLGHNFKQVVKEYNSQNPLGIGLIKFAPRISSVK